jgi:hypothetical protein
MVGLLLFGCGLIAGSIWSFWMLVRAVAAARSQLWRRCASRLAICVGAWPVAAILMFVGGDYVHLALAYPYYAAEGAFGDGRGVPIEFRWGSAGFAGSGNLERTLIYDPSGQLGAEIGNRRMPDEPSVQRSVGHLAGRFYLIEIAW